MQIDIAGGDQEVLCGYSDLHAGRHDDADLKIAGLAGIG